MKRIKVTVPGSCGELVQGKLNGRNFHITAPINLFTTVTLTAGGDKLEVIPSRKRKAMRAAEKTLKLLGHEDIRGKIHINSKIPEGKGMASSTADITGTAAAMSKFLGKRISDKKISEIALSIEPSDGVMFEGIVLFDHIKGRILEKFPNPPKMKILAVDTGGKINTQKFNRSNFDEIHRENRAKIIKALKLVEDGLREKDIRKIGKGATLSALCNQKILFKPALEPIAEISMKMGAVGVNVAHSGAIIGILMSENFKDFEELEKRIEKKLKRKLRFYRTQLSQGGWNVA